MIECTETQASTVQTCPRVRHIPAEGIQLAIVPSGIRHGHPLIGQHAPLVLDDLIQTLIVECSHQVGIHGLALTILHRECPLLLLARFESVTEGSPLQGEFLVRQRALYLCLMGVAMAILHPCVVEQQAITIFLFISELSIDQLTVSDHLSLLNHFFASKDTIEDVHVRCRRAHLDSNRRTIAGELGGRLIKPIDGIYHRFLIAQREHYEGALNGLILICDLYTMLT